MKILLKFTQILLKFALKKLLGDAASLPPTPLKTLLFQVRSQGGKGQPSKIFL